MTVFYINHFDSALISHQLLGHCWRVYYRKTKHIVWDQEHVIIMILWHIPSFGLSIGMTCIRRKLNLLIILMLLVSHMTIAWHCLPIIISGISHMTVTWYCLYSRWSGSSSFWSRVHKRSCFRHTFSSSQFRNERQCSRWNFCRIFLHTWWWDKQL